jgi:MFS family permease
MAVTGVTSRSTSLLGRTGVALPRAMAFWLVAGLLCLLMGAAGAPSPLYAVYQAQWHFSATTLTAVFAVYAVALLAALLVVGSLSDHVGRRPVIVAALAADVVAMVLFLLANDVGMLYAARAVQGLATGAATSALSAALIELQPKGQTGLAPLINSSAPAVGLGSGALVASALVQYGPLRTHLVFWLLLAALVAGIAGVLLMPEPAARQPGALHSMRPHAAVPARVRSTFAATLPCLVALWALGGFYLSLGPSLAAAMLRSENLLWGGAVIFLLMACAAGASILLRSIDAVLAMRNGSLTLLAGLGVTIGGIATSTSGLFLAGTAIAGCGFGLAFLGTFRSLTALAPAEERAALIATIYTASYLAFSVPVVIAGTVATDAGLRDTSLGYAAVLAALVTIAVVTSIARRAAQPSNARPEPASVDLPPCPCTLPHTSHQLAVPARR